MFSVKKLFALGALPLALAACGNKAGFIKDVKVSARQDSNKETFVHLEAQINAGKLRFPGISLPLISPRNPQKKYGSLVLQSPSLIIVDVNLTQAAGDKLANDSLLPNGQLIPVGGLTAVYGLQAGSNSKVYIGYSKENWMIGTAVAIGEFDEIARHAPGINLFLPLTGKVKGLAGAFTGTQSSSSGIGVFVEIPQASTTSLTMQTNSPATDSAIQLQSHLNKLSQKSKVVSPL